MKAAKAELLPGLGMRQVYTERRKTSDTDVAHRRNLMPRCVIITMRQIHVPGLGIGNGGSVTVGSEHHWETQK